MPDQPGPPSSRRRGPVPELGHGPAIDRQRRADTPEVAARLSRTPLGAYIPATDATHGTGARNDLPPSAGGPGRAAAVAAGLYRYDRSAPGQRPAAPEGETDAFDAPPLPYMTVERGKRRRT